MITSPELAQPANRRTVGGRAIRSISFDYSLTGYAWRANIEGIEAQFEVAQSETGVVGVGKVKEGGGQKADVDVEAGNGTRWVEVKNTEHLGLRAMTGREMLRSKA